MKKTLVAIIAGILLLPSAAFAQTVSVHDQQIQQLISSLLEQVKVLQAQLDALTAKKEKASEATAALQAQKAQEAAAIACGPNITLTSQWVETQEWLDPPGKSLALTIDIQSCNEFESRALTISSSLLKQDAIVSLPMDQVRMEDGLWKVRVPYSIPADQLNIPAGYHGSAQFDIRYGDAKGRIHVSY